MKIKKVVALVTSILLLNCVFSAGSFSGLYEKDSVSAEDVTVNEPSEQEHFISLEMSSAVVKPGEDTYVDVNICDNSGFCAFLVGLEFDHDVFTIENLSALPDFVDGYIFNQSKDKSKMILMTDLSKERVNQDSNVGAIRIKLHVKEDAPEGEYKFGFNEKDFEIATYVDNVAVEFDNHTLTPGTITVSKTAEPKTNLLPMSLGRVYAGESSENIIYSKTGDLTQDGDIDKSDVSKFSEYMMGTKSDANNADTTEDGKTNIADYISIKSYVSEG